MQARVRQPTTVYVCLQLVGLQWRLQGGWLGPLLFFFFEGGADGRLQLGASALRGGVVSTVFIGLTECVTKAAFGLHEIMSSENAKELTILPSYEMLITDR